MATKKVSPKKVSKMTSDAFAARMTRLHPKLIRALKGVLRESGVPGAKLNSAQLFLAHAGLSDSPCAQCTEQEVCVFDPLSGQWVCRPK